MHATPLFFMGTESRTCMYDFVHEHKNQMASITPNVLESMLVRIREEFIWIEDLFAAGLLKGVHMKKVVQNSILVSAFQSFRLIS